MASNILDIFSSGIGLAVLTGIITFFLGRVTSYLSDRRIASQKRKVKGKSS